MGRILRLKYLKSKIFLYALGFPLFTILLFQNCSGKSGFSAKNFSSQQQSLSSEQQPEIWAAQIQEEFYELLQNKDVLLYTVADLENLAFECLRNYTDCGKDSNKGYYLDWREIHTLKGKTDEMLFSTYNPNLGFFNSISYCLTYGTQSCNLRPEFKWYIDSCDEPCFDPNVSLMVRMAINTGDKNRIYTTQPSIHKINNFRSFLVNACDSRGGLEGDSPEDLTCHLVRQRTESCDIAHGTGTQIWQGESPITECKVNSCNENYAMVNNSCLPIVVACENSTGDFYKTLVQGDDGQYTSAYGNCMLRDCNVGFSKVGNQCLSDCPGNVKHGHSVYHQTEYKNDAYPYVCNSYKRYRRRVDRTCNDGSWTYTFADWEFYECGVDGPPVPNRCDSATLAIGQSQVYQFCASCGYKYGRAHCPPKPFEYVNQFPNEPGDGP